MLQYRHLPGGAYSGSSTAARLSRSNTSNGGYLTRIVGDLTRQPGDLVLETPQECAADEVARNGAVAGGRSLNSRRDATDKV